MSENIQPQVPIKPQPMHDPVCGMKIDAGRAKGGNATYQGETYDFCSDECREKFEANPARYAQVH